MADHAAAASDGAFGYRAALGRMQRLGHMLTVYMEAVDVVEQAVEGLQHHRHVPVEASVIRLLFTIQHHQRITHHAQAMGVGEGDGARQKPSFANPFQAGGVAVAVQHMYAGKARLLAGGACTRLDNRYTGQDVAAVGGASSHIAVADPYAGYVGDCIEWAGLQLAELDIQVAGTRFHRVFHGCSLV